MHKKFHADKKTGARNRDLTITSRRRRRPSPLQTPKSVKQLLANRRGPETRSWADWLRTALPAALAGHVVSALPKPPALIVFADNAAWAARLRYALPALQAAICQRDPALTRTGVRVQI